MDDCDERSAELSTDVDTAEKLLLYATVIFALM